MISILQCQNEVSSIVVSAVSLLGYYGTTINEPDDLIEAKEIGDLIGNLVNDVFVALDDNLR